MPFDVRTRALPEVRLAVSSAVWRLMALRISAGVAAVGSAKSEATKVMETFSSSTVTVSVGNVDRFVDA